MYIYIYICKKTNKFKIAKENKQQIVVNNCNRSKESCAKILMNFDRKFHL